MERIRRIFFSPSKEVIQEIYITKPSLYRMVLRFVNNNLYTVVGSIRITPENPNDIEQMIKVQFRNSSKPAFVTVSGETGNIPKPFVMNPGKWAVSINVNQSVLLVIIHLACSLLRLQINDYFLGLLCVAA